MTRRRWIAEDWDEATATLKGAQAEHLARVLRAELGMQADVVAGGFLYHAEISSVSPQEVRFNLLAAMQADPTLPITLVVSVFKFDHMEWGIEKATELGVATIVPVIARRTEKHLAQAAAKRVERWRRIAHEAAKQSRRSDVPEVLDPQPLVQRVKAAGDGVMRIVLAEQERGITLRAVMEEAMAAAENEMPKLELAFGPEGGWAPEEEALFDANGWRAASLGPRILRAETAAIAALAVVASLLE
jgi:16S rRNA (uracil1498-N3)-methyltransferase